MYWIRGASWASGRSGDQFSEAGRKRRQVLYSGIRTLSSGAPQKGTGRGTLVFRQNLSGSPVKNGVENNENERETGERTRP